MENRKAETILLAALDEPYVCKTCGNDEAADFSYEPEHRAEPDTGISASPPQVYCCCCGAVLWEGQTRAEIKDERIEQEGHDAGMTRRQP